MAIFAFKGEAEQMFCTQCGNDIEQHARFCSKCGHEIPSAAAPPGVAATAVPPKKTERDMDMHINILGWLLIGSGIFTAMGGFVLLFASQIIRRLPAGIAQGMDMPTGLPPFIAWIASIVGLCVLAMAAATTGAGVGLLQYRTWARTFAIIISVISLFHFPIGTAVAIYAFWVLLSHEGQLYYKTRSESTMTASGL
jgi:hypothetical protein